MACCLTAPSHYPNQCWLIISKIQWHSSEGNFTRDILAINHIRLLENYVSKISIKSPRGRWVKNISCYYFTLLAVYTTLPISKHMTSPVSFTIMNTNKNSNLRPVTRNCTVQHLFEMHSNFFIHSEGRYHKLEQHWNSHGLSHDREINWMIYDEHDTSQWQNREFLWNKIILCWSYNTFTTFNTCDIPFCVNLSLFVRRAGLLWSQQDFEWWWSVPLSSASLY